MYDIFTALLLVDHFSRRHHPVVRPKIYAEPESPWSRVFAWHRRSSGQ